MKPIEYFSRDIHSFWATSFQFELRLFDQFLLRRLGEAPLNAVVMCDVDCLTASLGRLTEVDSYLVRAANSRYLLRGVKLSGGGRFHPKTYLFAGRRGTILLVGSGNLTRSGLDRGRETFVCYEASRETDLPVIRAWANWMHTLVSMQDDPMLRQRFEYLRASVPELNGPGNNEAFLSNAATPLLQQVRDLAPSVVAELHVHAPYYDEQAQALERLIAELAPTESLHLYLGARTSVDGSSLRQVLDRAPCAVRLHRYEPSEFVHSKLVGVVGAEGAGLLLCGSANLSRAAIIETYGDGGTGNCEVLVVRAGSTEEIVQAFHPPGSVVTDLPSEELDRLAFEPDQDPPLRFRVRLLSVAFVEDGRLSIRCEEAVDGLSLAWRERPTPVVLEADGTTREAIPKDERPEVTWLVDAAGDRCSNSVVVDDPVELNRVLGEARDGGDRPRELRYEDGRSQLVGLLLWANRRFVFDIDDTAALRRANNAQELQADAEDTSFWERYAREELSYDHRSQTYRSFTAGGSLTDADLLLQELRTMLGAAPKDRRLRLLGGDAQDEKEAASGAGRVWSFTARERLRARNLLRRWGRALSDPRHAWISPCAPALNYEVLLDVLTLIWLGEGLDYEHIEGLLAEVWTSFIGTDRWRGFLQRADPELAEEAVESLGDDSRELAAGLAFTAMRLDAYWREWIYDWQPFLQTGLAKGIFRAGPLAVDLVVAFCDERPSPSELEELLHRRASWIDDETWGRRTSEELGLPGVRLIPRAGFKNVSLVVQVDSLPQAERDARLIMLARRAIALKNTDHVLLEVGQQRFLIRFGETCRARIDNQTRSSVVPIDEARLEAVEQQQGTLAELLGIEAT